MRLLRVGAAGQERPCVMREDGSVVDVSSLVPEYDGGFLAVERVASAPHPRDGWNTDELGIHLVALAIERGTRDAWEAHLTAASHEIVHRTDYTLYVRDPEGNRVGLSHWPEADAETETA